MTTVSVWVLIITLSGKGYVGNIDNIATKDECVKAQETIKQVHRAYGDSFCMPVKKAAHGIKGET